MSDCTFSVVSEKDAQMFPYPYVYIEDSGEFRELFPDERRYLEERFYPADGGRPYVKRRYSSKTPDGKIGGFLKRSKLPKKLKKAKPYSVTVKYDTIKMPDCCLVCGEGATVDSVISFNNGTLFGICGMGSVLLAKVPLCKRCQSQYLSKVKKQNLRFLVSFILGTALVVTPGVMLSKGLMLGMLVYISIALGFLLLIITLLFLMKDQQCFPVTFRAHKCLRRECERTCTFSFYDHYAAEQFSLKNNIPIEHD